MTCANLRPEKNHKRQIEVAKKLKKAGIEFIWYNIGALTDTNLLKQTKDFIKQTGLEKEFLFLGPKEKNIFVKTFVKIKILFCIKIFCNR